MFDLQRIGRGLAVSELIPDLPGHGAQVIQAPPGTGKTTLVPPALANLHPNGRVLVVAPRRVAVRAAALRLAELSGHDLGTHIGFSVRGEHHEGSRVQFMTPGVLLRKLLADPELSGVSAVVIDEVHERAIDTDLAVGMLHDLRGLREDLQLVVMSATLSANQWGNLIAADRVLSTESVMHPLEIEYRPHRGSNADAERLRTAPEFLDHVADCVREAQERQPHSVLVFVPGVREVEELVARIDAALPLHGRLHPREQARVLCDDGTPRVVVATAVAESSVTVGGVRAVVDAGHSRVPRRDRARNMTGLVTVNAARATLTQRAGRAGREGPGLVIRCLREEDIRHLPAEITPEIQTADLTDAVLQVAAWGTPRGEGLHLPDPFPPEATADAEATLVEIGALHADGTITEHGRRLADLPVEPRHAHALVTLGDKAAPTIAALSEGCRGHIGGGGSAPASAHEIARLRRLAPASTGEVRPGDVVACAYPLQIGRQIAPGATEYLLASGTRAHLDSAAGILPTAWLAVAELQRSGQRAIIRAAASIDENCALRTLPVTEDVQVTLRGEDGKLRPRQHRVQRAGAIELSRHTETPDPEHVVAALIAEINSQGLESVFRLDEQACALRDRLHFLHTHRGEPWPDMTQIHQRCEDWLLPEIELVAGGKTPEKISLHDALRRLLPWPEAAQLEDLAPTHLQVPSGRNIPLDYSGEQPALFVKLQECFGLADSPKILGVPVLFHLLSPAGRPAAITADLASFWSGPYKGVRAELRGRYPKHPWPEDPWTAPATHRTTRKR